MVTGTQPPAGAARAGSRPPKKRRTAGILVGLISIAALAAGIYLVVTSLGDKDRLLIPAYAHVLGQPDAPVTIIEWSDFQ
jgi:protein-disulfide isomerase